MRRMLRQEASLAVTALGVTRPLAFRPHVRAVLRNKFQRRIVGHNAHDLCLSRLRTLWNTPEAAQPNACRKHPGANSYRVFSHCLPSYRLQCRNDAKVAWELEEVTPYYDRKASSACATRMPTLRTTRSAATASNIGDSIAINLGA